MEKLTCDITQQTWEETFRTPDIVGLVYRENEDSWYVDCRFKRAGDGFMVFGNLGISSDENNCIPVPSDAAMQFLGVENQTNGKGDLA